MKKNNKLNDAMVFQAHLKDKLILVIHLKQQFVVSPVTVSV